MNITIYYTSATQNQNYYPWNLNICHRDCCIFEGYGICSTKYHLNPTLTSLNVTFQEVATIITAIEAILHSIPSNFDALNVYRNTKTSNL
uniref:Uncharacterized protein n=1 Tax=Glossina palpalis gambiensis TaxID=67801 RepID=A0A1B0BEM9_9MUSC